MAEATTSSPSSSGGKVKTTSFFDDVGWDALAELEKR
jgi:hypothetical protein